LATSRLFARRDVGQGASAESAQPLERQQAALLVLLRHREGAPVSFSELQGAGIEFPASVVSELELAGAPIERCVLRQRDASVVGVRLDPLRKPAHLHAPSPHVGAPSAGARPARGERVSARLQNARWLAPAALLTALGVIAALALAELTTGNGRAAPHALASSHAHKPTFSATAHGSSGQATSARRTPHGVPFTPPPTPVSEALAMQLEAQGHELLEAGRSGDAVQVLTRAVSATGQHLGECLQPASETCLTYAYALYDLGRALQLDGHPAAAVPVLQDRLQIDNQRPTVAVELDRARAQTG
jgi:hypothetical protein